MEWCLDCHEKPEREVRPQAELFTFGRGDGRLVSQMSERTETAAAPRGLLPVKHQESQPQLAADYGIVTKQLRDCVICHR